MFKTSEDVRIKNITICIRARVGFNPGDTNFLSSFDSSLNL